MLNIFRTQNETEVNEPRIIENGQFHWKLTWFRQQFDELCSINSPRISTISHEDRLLQLFQFFSRYLFILQINKNINDSLHGEFKWVTRLAWDSKFKYNHDLLLSCYSIQLSVIIKKTMTNPLIENMVSNRLTSFPAVG